MEGPSQGVEVQGFECGGGGKNISKKAFRFKGAGTLMQKKKVHI